MKRLAVLVFPMLAWATNASAHTTDDIARMTYVLWNCTSYFPINTERYALWYSLHEITEREALGSQQAYNMALHEAMNVYSIQWFELWTDLPGTPHWEEELERRQEQWCLDQKAYFEEADPLLLMPE